MGRFPTDVLGMDRTDVIGFWNDIADGYSAKEQGDIPGRIVGDLVDTGVISAGSRVLEIGSGPGTYSVPLAKAVSKIECLDSSERMLSRLREMMRSQSLDNVGYCLSDWGEYDVPDVGFDAVVASLCPFAGSPESIARMEACSESWCVLVSWEVNEGDGVSERIWRELGYDCDFKGRSSEAVIDRLRESGRDPVVRRYDTVVEYDIPTDELTEHSIGVFRAYGIGEDEVKKAMDVLYPDDLAHFENHNRMRTVCWKVSD